MNTSIDIPRRKPFLYIWLAIALLACWWIGWRDFDPNMAQEAVRENIRSSIRGAIQMFIQYLIPLAILVFFAKEAIINSRSRLRGP